MKKITVSKLKNKLDGIYSQYIRYKNSVDGYCVCVTCGVRKPIKEMQCGHYVSRSYNSTRYLEKNTHCQCLRCNVFLSGNMDEYTLFMIKKYGTRFLYKLKQLKNQIKQFTITELEEKIEYYKKLLKEICCEK
jgi:hypothetical protein